MNHNDTSTTRTSGPGGYHASITGRPMMLMMAEDAGGSGGSPGAASTTTTTSDQSGTAPTAGGNITFTAEQQQRVNAIAAAARAEGKQSAERALQQQAQPTQSQQATPPAKVTLESLQAELAETRLRGAFDKRAAKLNIPDDEVDDMFELYRNKPADTRDTWLDGKAKRFMPVTTNTNTTTTSTTTTEAKPPAAAPNAPGRVDPLTAGGLVDIWALNDDQLKQLGPMGLREKFEALKTAARAASGAPPRPKLPSRR